MDEYVFIGIKMRDDSDERTSAILVKTKNEQEQTSLNAFIQSFKEEDCDKFNYENYSRYDSFTGILWNGESLNDYRATQKRSLHFVDLYKENHPNVSKLFETWTPEPSIIFEDVSSFYSYIGYDKTIKKFNRKWSK